MLTHQAAIGSGVAVTLSNRFGASGQVYLKTLCNSSVGIGLGYNVNAIHVMTPRQAARRKARLQQSGFNSRDFYPQQGHGGGG